MRFGIKSGLLFLALLQLGIAADYVVKNSSYSVDRTTQRFTAIIKKKGFTLFSVIDHKANAHSVGLEMDDSKVIIFGNPKGGTLLMNADMRISLELPLKVAVFKDAKGVHIMYKKPQSYQKSFKLKGSAVIKKMIVGLDKLTDAASK